MHCLARLPLGAKPQTIPGPFGFPAEVQIRCNQVVGVTTWYGSDGRPLGACAIPGHEEDVLAQDADRITLRWDAPRRSLELEERSRHDMEEAQRG